ncbi:MAG: hypothetical protein HGB32_11455 [Geobacteraceae bacterium]|nr:hypothetical protein [Geobacteraceae bacterium]NTW80745.1 hypothetical protein [Geobacteraceae bacterium]
MELRTYRQHNEHLPNVTIESLQFAEKKMNYDSRYRSIIAQLDTMTELLRQQPDRKLTTELDNLLDDMIHHIGSENRFMELVGYPQAAKHRNHHYCIFEITEDLNLHFRMGENVTPEELDNIRFLWMIHILRHDRAFEEFLAF